MKVEKNIIIKSSGGKPMLTDVFYSEDEKGRKPAIIYAHGFNGFKDWGNFDLIAEQFAEAGFVFVKFNFSHNGTTVDAPEHFNDLQAFAENNYTKELDDLGNVIEWLCGPTNPAASVIDVDNISLLGHSMGGGIVILKAGEDKRIKSVATWASIGECKTPWGKWPQEKLRQWKAEGVAYIANSRTKQDMPLNYQLLEDYEDNEERLDIKKTVQHFKIPLLLCHGSNDEAVSVATAKELHAINPKSELFLIDSDHVFGRKHPWTKNVLPEEMQAVVNKTINFFQLHTH